MRKTILIAALGASGFAAVACTAQSSYQNNPQTAAQANAAVLDQAPPSPPPPGGAGRGGGRGMMRADANRDGVVTRAEAIADADRRFDAIDTDHDGQVTGAEMQASRDMMHRRMEARGADVPPPPPGGAKHGPGMGRRADPDGNGVITRAEFEARAGTRFDRIDANHDGRLDRSELAAMGDMRRERRGEMGDTPPPGQ